MSQFPSGPPPASAPQQFPPQQQFAPPPPQQFPPGMQPPTLGYATPVPARADLRAIAMRQRGIMYCILGYLVLVAAQFAVPEQLRIIPGLLALVVSVAAAVFVFMLALSVYNTAAGVVLGILTLVPLIGLIILLIINARATKILRQHGIRVGLMGADPRQIPAPGQAPSPM
jgi:hypothetical protein